MADGYSQVLNNCGVVIVGIWQYAGVVGNLPIHFHRSSINPLGRPLGRSRQKQKGGKIIWVQSLCVL